jgi:hypothetical protein
LRGCSPGNATPPSRFARWRPATTLTSGSGVADHASALRRGQLPAAIEGLEKLASERDRGRPRRSPARLGVAYWWPAGST